MKVKDLIEILKDHNENNDVVFYYLENYNLQSLNLESVLEEELSNQTEITVTFEEAQSWKINIKLKELIGGKIITTDFLFQ